MALPPLCQRDMQHVKLAWVPWNLEFRYARGLETVLVWCGWILLPAGLVLSFRLDPEKDEREVFRFGPFVVTRPETEEEREEREEAEAEDDFMIRELNRYCEWSY